MITSDLALIGTTIHRVAQLIQQRIDNEIGDSGLTRLSWMGAAHVEDSPGLTIGDLAGRLEVGRATAGQLVDRMVQGGWAERWASPDDRRSQIVTATPKAGAARADQVAAWALGKGESGMEKVIVARQDVFQNCGERIPFAICQIGQAQDMAAGLAENAPLAMRSTRKTLRADLAAAVRAATDHEFSEQQWLMKTDDFKEGVRAVSERRPGDFKGR